MADFPSLVPSSRSFNPGDYPTRRYQTLNGTVWKRSFGNVRVGMTIEMQFANISDDKAALIWNHYRSEAGTLSRFDINPAFVFGGASTGLRQAASIDPSVRWAYAEPPRVDSVFPGISTVNVTLVGEIDFT
jgi:hypothetical protein